MIKRERAARIAAENRAIAIQQQAAVERERFMATMDELAMERRQAAADRERFMASITEERQQTAAALRQAAEERLRLMDTINDLVAQQRNGNHGGSDHGSNGQ